MWFGDVFEIIKDSKSLKTGLMGDDVNQMVWQWETLYYWTKIGSSKLVSVLAYVDKVFVLSILIEVLYWVW